MVFFDFGLDGAKDEIVGLIILFGIASTFVVLGMRVLVPYMMGSAAVFVIWLVVAYWRQKKRR